MTLEEKILEKIKSQNSEWHKPKQGYYHASGIYDICSGKTTPDKFLNPPEFNDRTLIIFEIGKMYHQHIQEILDGEDEKEIKIECAKGIHIVGRVDKIIKGNPFEIKTCSRFPEEPKIEHIYQVQCYMEALNKDYAYLLYVLKDQKEFPSLSFKIVRDKKLMEEIKQKVVAFDKLVCSRVQEKN